MNMNNWQIKKLKYFLKVKHGKDQKLIEDKNGIYTILASGGEIGKTNSYIYNKPSVLIGRKGTIDKPQYIEKPFWTIDTLFYTIIENNNKPKFFYYLFQTINWYKYNEGSTVPSLNSTTIESIVVKVPLLPEQEKIVSILSKQDEVIEKLEKLIELKTKQKKGLMQKLLSGKVRLKGFDEEWKEVRLKEIANLYQPKTISQSVLTDQGYPVYGANGLIGYFSKFNHKTWQITITCRGSTSGMVNRTSGPAWITGNAMVINCDNFEINKIFLYYKLLCDNFSSIISGSGQPQIILAPLLKWKIYIPSNIQEQSAIASILSKSDEEIELLKHKLELCKKQKKWLMQKLLSGEIRVDI